MHKTMGMMKCIVKFHESCLKIVEDTSKSEKKVSMGMIESALKDSVVYELTQMKYQLPTLPEVQMRSYFDKFEKTIEAKFSDLRSI